MRNFATICLCFLLAVILLPARSQAEPGQLYKLFVQDGQGNLSFVDFIETETGELQAAAGACNGGTCLTSTGVILDCPDSGGPTCAEGEVCSCRCVKNREDNTWSAVNKCVKKLVAIDEEPFPT